MSCDYTALNFACNGDGYLTLGAGAATGYPCPRCNTAIYLEKCYRAAQARQSDNATCICCGPGLSFDSIWSTAIQAARACNPEVAEAAIRDLVRHGQKTRFRADESPIHFDRIKMDQTLRYHIKPHRS